MFDLPADVNQISHVTRAQLLRGVLVYGTAALTIMIGFAFFWVTYTSLNRYPNPSPFSVCGLYSCEEPSQASTITPPLLCIFSIVAITIVILPMRTHFRRWISYVSTNPYIQFFALPLLLAVAGFILNSALFNVIAQFIAGPMTADNETISAYRTLDILVGSIALVPTVALLVYNIMTFSGKRRILFVAVSAIVIFLLLSYSYSVFNNTSSIFYTV